MLWHNDLLLDNFLCFVVVVVASLHTFLSQKTFIFFNSLINKTLQMSYDGVMMMLPLPPLFGMHIKIEVKIRDLIVNLKIFFFFFCLFACQD